MDGLYEQEPRLCSSMSTTPAMCCGINSSRSFNARTTGAVATVHVYDTERSRPMRVVRPGKTPSGVGARYICASSLRHILLDRDAHHGDGHYARPEAMEWCEANHIDYVFPDLQFRSRCRKSTKAADAGAATEHAVDKSQLLLATPNTPQAKS